MRNLLAEARSFLFVPCNRPERFDKALHSGADAVVLDLEDSVPSHEKPAAREALAAAWHDLRRSEVLLVVRSNCHGSAAWSDDLALFQRLPGLEALMVPKAESSDMVASIRAASERVLILPLIETAAGFDSVKSIAGAPGVLRLVVGHLDFMTDTGITCDQQELELAPLRFAVTMATRLHSLAPAIDGVTVQTSDEARLVEDTMRARRFGFGGKLCIHPRQIAVVHEALAPTPAELDWARRVVEADRQSEGAAVQLDGRMVDLPVVLQAKRLLNRD